MRRREDQRELPGTLAALAISWFRARPDERRRELVLRFFGRLPDERDAADACEVLVRVRSAR